MKEQPQYQKKKGGQRVMFGATIVHLQPKEMYVNFFQEQRKLRKKRGQHVDTAKLKEVPLRISCLITCDQGIL